MRQLQKLRTGFARLACGGLACLAAVTLCAALGAGRAEAQEILPFDLVPAPAGTNVILGYYIYGHSNELRGAGPAPTFKDRTNLEVNIGLARFVHFFNFAGMPAGWQVFQPFGGLRAQVEGQSLGSAFGAQNLALGAFFWPYANQASKTYFIVSGFLYPPTGTYDPHSPLNVGDNRWRGDLQLGFNKGFGPRLSTDTSFDVMFYGDNNNAFPGGQKLTQDPTFRVQTFLNWNWTRQFITSIGYEGFFGGAQQVNGFFNGSKTEEQRIRAVATYFFTPAIQGMLELNHDFQAVGTFKQAFGLQARLFYVF